MSAHENLEHAEHAEHAAHGGNKGIALVIAILALFLAFSETLGKSAQTAAPQLQPSRPNDDWAFFQAKTIRMWASSTTAAEAMTLTSKGTTDEALKAAQAKQIEAWRKEAARNDDDPGRNGRKQLMREGAPESEKSTGEAGDWRAITTTNSPPRRSRSASCSPRRPSSPA